MFVVYLVMGFVSCISLFWIFYSSNYFLSGYDLSGVAQILPSDMSYVLFSVALPVILMLLIGIIAYVIVANNQNKTILTTLLSAVKSEMSGVQTISKSLIEVRKLGFTNQFFANLSIVFDDISRFLADIISKSGIVSQVVVLDSMNKTGEARLYALCKIILDKKESTPRFEENLKKIIKKDPNLAGMIMIFSEKYEKFLKVIRKYDLDGFVYSMVEEGELGKVHNVLVKSLSFDEDVKSSDIEGKEESISFLEDEFSISPSN